MGSKREPGKFDCYSNALPDEPMFILLARDSSAPNLVEAWATIRENGIKVGIHPQSDMAMVAEARQCAENMGNWLQVNYGKWRNASPATAALGTQEDAYGNLLDISLKQLEQIASHARTIEALRAAAKPFAKIADLYDNREDDAFQLWIDAHEPDTRVTLGMCREVRRALKEHPNG